MPKYLTNTTFFNDGLGTYIANGVVQTNKFISNGDVVLSGVIQNGSNYIRFNDQYQFIDIDHNMHIYGTGYIDWQGTTYNIGEILSAFVGTGTISPYPSITYNSTTGETTFTGTLIFPNSSIASGAIINNDFLTYSTNQNVSGQKTFSGTQIFSTIQLNGDLIVNSGGTTLSNSNLSKIQYISGLASDLNTRLNTDETNITTLQTKTTGLSYSGTTTSISNTLSSSTFTVSTSINGTTKAVFDNILLYCNSLSENVQTAIITNSTNISTLQTKTQYISSTSLNTTITNTTNLTDVVFSTSINGATKLVFDNVMLYCNSLSGNVQTAINSVNSNITTNTNDISTLQTKTQYISSTSLNTTITETLNTNNLVFSKLNTLPASYFTGINANIQDSITDAVNKANAAQGSANNAIDKASTAQNKADSAYNLALGAQTTASSAFTLAGTAQATAAGALALAGTAQSSANTANTGLATLNTTVDGIEVDVGELQVKTTQMSYNSATSRTTIDQTLYSPNLEIGNLTSGFTQTQNSPITIIGILTCDNAVNINGTLYLENNNSMIIEGIINQNTGNAGTNLFQAPTTFFGNVIMSGTSATINATTTQIGTSAASNFNCNSTATFGGDITMSITKKLTLKNIVPILLDSIYFGGEAGGYLNDDVVFNMKIEANRPVAINNTFQVGTTITRNTSNSYTTTTLLDANTGMTLTSPTILITAPLVNIGQLTATSITLNSSGVYIGQLLGSNYLYGTTYVQNLYSASGILGMAGQVFQQF